MKQKRDETKKQVNELKRDKQQINKDYDESWNAYEKQ